MGILLSLAHAPSFAFHSHDDMFLPVFDYLTMPAGQALFTQVIQLRSSKTYDLKNYQYLKKSQMEGYQCCCGENVSVITNYF